MPNGHWRQMAAALALIVMLAGGTPASAEENSAELPEGLDPAQLDAAIRAYILEHPEVIVEALHLYDAKVASAERQRARDAIAILSDQLYDNPLSPVGGNPDGDVTVVEFFDYNCPYCKRVAPDLQALAQEDGGIRIVYKEWPILSPESEIAARAALAAGMQGDALYEAFHNALMAYRGKLDRDGILAIASSQGLNIERLEEDMAGAQVTAELQHVAQLADQIGISGTPAFLIGGELVPGAISVDDMRKLIVAARDS